jgi:hypothetical protein
MIACCNPAIGQATNRYEEPTESRASVCEGARQLEVGAVLLSETGKSRPIAIEHAS